MKKIITSVLAATLAISSVNADKLVIKGSDTLGAKLVPQLAEQFKVSHPDVAFEIAAEGSSTGVAAIIDGTADVGMSSRDPKRSELSKARVSGVDMQKIAIAYDGIAVIVNEANPLSALSKKDVEKIFTGDVSDWSAVGANPGAISIYTRNTSSGTYSSFKKLAMHKRDYARSSQKMAGNEQIASEVAHNPNGIGYVGLAYTDVEGIKVLAIGGVKPTQEKIVANEYPYARPLYYLLNAKVKNALSKEFIDFTLAEPGQKIVEKVHFVPVN